MNVLIAVIAAIVVIFILNEKIQEHYSRRELREAERELQHAKSEIQRSLEAICAEVIPLINQHMRALLRQRRQKLYKDAYDQMIFDDWFRELEYFVESVILPRVNTRTLDAWQQAQEEGSDASRRAVELGVRLTPDPEKALAAVVFEKVVGLVETAAAVQNPDGSCDPCDPNDFEILCDELLTKAGWKTQRIGGSGDQGADVIAERDGRRGAFQCKLYQDAVGNAAVQQAYTAMTFYGADFAAVVSTSGYTKSARQAAQATGVHLLHPDDLGERFRC